MQKTFLSAAIAASLSLSVQAQTTETPEQTPIASAPQLETLVIVSSRTETPLRQIGTSVSVLEEADIKALGFQSLPDVLRTLPSVSITNTGGMGRASSLRVRGEAGYRTLVRVDGVDISDPTGTQVSSQIQHLLSASATRVELLRGPQGMMYGADAGGVLNITTDRRTDDFGGGVSAEAGRYDSQTYNGHVSAGNDTGDFYLSAAHATTDGFNVHVADESGEPDGYENTTLHGRAGLNIGRSLRAELVLRDTDAEAEHDHCGFPAIHDCVGFFNQRNARASVTHSIAQSQNTLAFSKTDVERTNYDGGEVSYDTQGEISRWELNGSGDLTPFHGLAYGMEYRSDQVMELERNQRGAYVEYQGAFQERFYVTAGVRHDDNDDFGGTTSYRVSAAYLIPAATGTVKFKSSLGTGFRAPSLFEIDYNRSQETDMAPLQQEDSRGLDVGVEYFGRNGLHLEAVMFDQRVDNEIYFDLVGFTGYIQGGQRSESRGLELISTIPLSDRFSINGNYTYVDTEASDGSPRSRQPKHLANLGFNYQPVQPLTLSLNWRAARDIVDRGTELDNYQVVSGSARYQVTQGLVVYVHGENIFDEDYQEVPNYNTAGAAGYAGVELTF
ncbi:TonB-dependent siderophore receptor [Marinimicrobium sp. ABcell2]|uniref:TonB-dependent receptor plug domain-containing protein n=1 Tax=Marinimicrobium sp. ABcell2 TaxID=3069751 RepID=UPI0027ADF44F|nr:TonB-dependent receptor [Marinimicrobium sp. ABcell2]MDQ2076728.1 TonB-dependent receptor [Marinimicrobium sp. ABcell2]